MSQMNFHRQLDVVDHVRLSEIPITVVGAGAVGSCTAVALAKCGAERLIVWDDDVVEAHNLPNQWYGLADVGQPKVGALRRIVADLTGVVIDEHCQRFSGLQATEITICCVDSMDVRIAIWQSISPRPLLYVDARMGAEVGKLHCVGPLSSWYEDTLFPSSEAFRAPCTARATMYCATGLAALIASQVVGYASGRPVKPEVTVDFRNCLIL